MPANRACYDYGYAAAVAPVARGESVSCDRDHTAITFSVGELDTIVLVEDVRAFVTGLRSASDGPVVYAELPGAQHTFDLFHSLRFESVVDGIQVFTAWVRSRAAT